MKVIRISQFTGIEHTLEIPITEEQLQSWQDGELIEKAMPKLSVDEREFIKTGITPDEWNEVFKEL